MPLKRAKLLGALVLLIAWTVRGETACAQTHVIEAGIPMSSASARDDLLVPIAATGSFLGLMGRYQLGVASERFEAELGLGVAVMFDHFDNAAVQLPHTLALGYGHVVQRSRAAVTELGANVRWQTEVSYFEAWDDAHGYWLATLSFGPTIRNAFELGDRLMLETRAELALFGLADRPPRYRWNKQDALTHVSYYADRLDDLDAFGLWDAQMFRIETLARARVSTDPFATGFGAGTSVRLARADWPEPYVALYLGLLLDYGWSI